MRKKIVIIFVMLIGILTLSSCSFRKYYYNISDYSEIWKLSGFRHGYDDQSTFFPDNIEEMDIKNFFCRYDENLPLGESIQICLEIHFENENLFDSEVQRISEVSFECSEKFKRSQYTAYATRLGDYDEFENSIRNSYEYALIDQDQNTIYYIYLQSLDINKVGFEHNLLPDDY